MDICASCHVGHLTQRRVTYLVAFGGAFVTLPGMPAWLCDACGELTYDAHLLARLDMLLGVDDELEPGRRPAARRSTAELGADDRAVRRRV